MTKKQVRLYHAGYGCETGCCGHVIEIGDDERFEFTHPYGENLKTWAKSTVIEAFGEEHCKDIDWDDIDVEDVSDC